jgi:hypothetical protein
MAKSVLAVLLEVVMGAIFRQNISHVYVPLSDRRSRLSLRVKQ